MDPSADELAIRQVIQDSVDASNRGDLDGYARHLAEDLIYYITGVPPMRGRESFIGALRTLASECTIHAECDVEEVKVMGDHAFCITRLTIVLTPHDGAPRRRSGNTMALLRREPDRHWVIFRDVNLIPEL